MRLNFRWIAVFILFSVLSVFIYQGYWLKAFYNEQSAKLEVDIMDALRSADSKEVNFQKGSHQIPRDINSIDFSVYNNFLQIELIQRGIVLESFTEIFDLRNNHTLTSLPKDTSMVDRLDYKAFVFPFDVEGNYAYRLSVKQPGLFLLKQMSGILITSLLMIVSLFLSYIYLLKVIYRQKTLDEIKSDFVNNMTHELKTPISVVYAVTDALQNYGMMDDPVKREEYLNVSKKQLQHLNGLVEQILTMSVEERKNLKLTLEEIRLSELFRQLKTQYLLNAPKEVTIDIDVEPEGIVAKIDTVHFHNVMGNLIENAIKYSAESVCITISAHEEKKMIAISVKDDGIGIPSASLPKIFDRFYRVSTGNIHNVKGYGLGLYYVKMIVEKHGGTVEAESKEGRGTAFKILIPTI